MVPLSAVLIAQNEERKIEGAIASVAFCDEIVLVDSGSRDGTREIAAAAGARVLVNAPWPGFVAQRDFAVRAARHDWVVALDADERVGAALREEMLALRARGFAHAGYRIPRVACYLGRWIRGTDWYPDWQVRLFDRTRGGWRGDLVHESVSVRGPVGRLHGEMEHHPYSDIADHLRKIDAYTTLWARQAHAAGRRTNLADMTAGASWAFFRNYVLKRGFLLGGAGFIVSVLNTHYTFAKLAKLRELQRPASSTP
ncbi:MAG TPA: glycosyltransferase family 2 protein [Vicinamibacteria bacterium]|nr:glycosyltransferase family 2 protein [Vicinamibacteria bacterium]